MAVGEAVEQAAPTQREVYANTPEGLDALVLAERVREAGVQGLPWLHIARDDARMEALCETLAFVDPDLEILSFPAWDCLPYDRISPRPDILAQRLSALVRIMGWGAAEGAGSARPRIVVTTVNAAAQRVIPNGMLRGRALTLSIGEQCDPERIIRFLAANGYGRTATVSEPGEYALRGGILDLYPPVADDPLRLDFFGDELETIRPFDALSQRSRGKLDRLLLLPVNEVILEEGTIGRFRSGYRELFGVSKEDPLYEAISAGRPHPGMEHWLPLFYGELESLFDYLPQASVSLDHQAEEVRNARQATIDDFYEARQTLEGVPSRGAASGEWVYRALPPDRLYLPRHEWTGRLEARAGGAFSPFAVPERDLPCRDAGGRPADSYSVARQDPDGHLFERVAADLASHAKAGRRVVIAAQTIGSRSRLAGLLADHGGVEVAEVGTWAAVNEGPAGAVYGVVLPLERGFIAPGFAILSEQDILGERFRRKARQRKKPENFLREVSALEPRDLVVHREHGIGRYEGLLTIEVHGAAHDCLNVVYHGGDKLFVPVENIDVLSRYGQDEGGAELDRLGGASWQLRRAKVKDRLKMMAKELIKVAAVRETQQVEELRPQEGLYDEFAARFPYPETEDQARAITETLRDLSSGRPMDRLICGDVGFGKTEVALRAAFVAALSGFQVAIVVPTTLLARQHYSTFRERFVGLPLQVAQLSRLVGARDQAKVKEGLAKGTLDIVIGTHALLAESIRFRDLGLLIVDEEQHFGVKQKERLKKLKEAVHVLTLTATPIPRTLQLAMSGVKEMSLIASPPVDRLAVRTFVLPYDPVIVREAIMREHHRGGQIFYVCPRVQDLAELQERLTSLVPEIKIAVAHGQLAPSELEAVMTDFYDRKFELLLSTNIVESGLDIPTANTMILHRADMFGLSQLYQLRGRIGRSKLRGYAYFTLPQGRLLTATAQKRLEVMQTLDSLGAGFQLASHDMDIRGAGNLLGEEQSGHVREVGIELYQQMLEEAVAAARGSGAADAPGEGADQDFSPQIQVGTAVLIPETYVTDLSVRLGLYRRVSTLVDGGEIEGFAAELIDRFGPLPAEVENLLQVITIKLFCRRAGIARIDAGPKGATVAFHKDRFANPAGLIDFIQRQAGKVQLRPDHTLLYKRAWSQPEDRVKGVLLLVRVLAKLAGTGA